MFTYKRTRSGERMAFGPLHEARDKALKAGSRVAVVNDETGERRTEVVVHVSRPFPVQGVPHVYIKLRPKWSTLSKRGKPLAA